MLVAYWGVSLTVIGNRGDPPSREVMQQEGKLLVPWA